MRKNWVLHPVDEDSAREMAGTLRVSPVIARLLIRRGIRSLGAAEQFLFGDIGCLALPSRMAGLDRAVELIRRALRGKQRILIVGDYDVDGLTSSALLQWVLRSLGAEVSCHIPHRMEDGYGLKPEVVEEAHRSGVRLLITTDCGTSSFKELDLARRLGMETVVVDHHDLDPAGHPPASAFLNPLRTDCSYPEKELSSAGVAFTLARGLLNQVPGTGTVPGAFVSGTWEHLDLVALSTVADMAPLSGENRILVRAGLHALEHTRKPGLRALLAEAQLDGIPLTPEEISFRLAPPLNAAGRMGSAEASFRLLTTGDPVEAEEAVKSLFKDNRARRALEGEAFKKALVKVAREINFSRDRVIILEDEKWHPGVAGILATRLTHRFHRPTVVIAVNGTTCRGSARSTRALDLVQALHSVREHLVEFGGHPGAAGLTIERDRIAPFREALNRVAHERMDRGMLSPLVELDGELPLSELTEELMREMDALAPFGTGNPRPVFLSRDARLPAERGQAGFHPMGVRVTVQDPQGNSFEALQPRDALGDGLNLRRVRGSVHLAYSPVARRRQDRFHIELRLRDLKLP
jgi:single-stranded-DNA-specific exonuclease